MYQKEVQNVSRLSSPKKNPVLNGEKILDILTKPYKSLSILKKKENHKKTTKKYHAMCRRPKSLKNQNILPEI